MSLVITFLSLEGCAEFLSWMFSLCANNFFCLSAAHGDTVFSIFANNRLVCLFINYPHRSVTSAFSLYMSSKNKHTALTHGSGQLRHPGTFCGLGVGVG